MGIKFWIKNICYGANRCTREEIIRVIESVRMDMHAAKRELYQELLHLKRAAAFDQKKIKLLQEQQEKDIAFAKQQSEKKIHLLQEQHHRDMDLLHEQHQKDMDLLLEQNKKILHAAESLPEKLREQSAGIPEAKIHAHIDTVQRDLLLALERKGSFLPDQKAEVHTQYPVATESNDHLYPRGTRHDNTRAPHFITKCEELLGQDLKFLDLGCSGGGLVLDGILKGHFAMGLEGSDYSKKTQRAEWRLLKDYLFTCDITKPFQIRDAGNGEQIVFDVISAWEVLEHIREEDLPALLNNISLHLSDSGYFVGTMSQAEDQVNGVSYHQTIRDYGWWKDVFEKNGFQVVEGLFAKEDLARGNGNPPNCWMLDWGPENSQFLAAKKKPEISRNTGKQSCAESC